MTKALLIAVRTTAVTLIVTGIIYPYVVTGLAQLSELIGQGGTHPAYFQPRPSAAGAGYEATASSGSNLGPTSKKLQDRVTQDLERLKEENPDAPGPAPIELVTTSGSGLDPHLSPQAALWQVPRVARTRGVAPERVRAVVEAYSEGRDLGLLGEPRVNILLLNLALDRQFGRPAAIARQEGQK